MVYEDKWERVLVCPSCGESIDAEYYGLTDDERDELYPTMEDVLGYDDAYRSDESGEYYDPEFDE